MSESSHQVSYGDYLRFRELIRHRSGLDYPEKKRGELELGLIKALQEAPPTIKNVDDYYTFLVGTSSLAAQAEMKRLINVLTIGETHFFRDAPQFDALVNQVLPELIAQKRASAKAVGQNPPISPQLRIWSAGAASGEEPYSIAMLLHELIPDIANWHILILATDINQDSLEKAKKGVYTNWSFRETRAKSKRALYFTPHGKVYKLKDHIKKMVTFAPLNLINDDFPAVYNNTVSMDMIICRNVTIYFDEETTRSIIQKFYQSLIQGGWLVVGHSEPSLTIYRDFKSCPFAGTLLYKKTTQTPLWPNNWEESEFTQPSQPSQSYKPATKPLNLNNDSKALNKPLSNQLKPNALPPLTELPSQRTVFLSPPSLQQSQIPQQDDPYQVARILLDKGYSNQAIQTLQNKLDFVPETQQADAYCLLARAYADLGQWDKAEQWGQKAIKLNTLLAEAYFILALINEHQGNIKQAIKNLKKVIYLDHQKPLPHFNIAMLYKKSNRLQQANSALNNAINLLKTWPPEAIIPDSGGTSARRLLRVATQLKNTMEETTK